MKGPKISGPRKKQTLEELARTMNKYMAAHYEDRQTWGKNAAMIMPNCFAAIRATKRFWNAARKVR